MKKKKRKSTTTTKKPHKFKKGFANPNAKLEACIRAKALYLESTGAIPCQTIAENVGVTTDTIYRWRKEGKWDDELGTIKKAIDEKFKLKMLATSEVQGMLKDVTEEQLTEAMKSLVSKNVTEAVSDFLTKIHKNDIEDLSELNKAIRLQLRPGYMESLKPIDISNLVNAKTNIIKAVRNIFGETTGDAPVVEQNQYLQVVMSADQASSMEELKKAGELDLTDVVSIN